MSYIVDFAIPSLHLSPWSDPAGLTNITMRASSAVRTSSDTTLAAAFVLSCVYFDGLGYNQVKGNKVNQSAMKAQLQVLQQYSEKQVAAVH
jgi:hypothetical protein